VHPMDFSPQESDIPELSFDITLDPLQEP